MMFRSMMLMIALILTAMPLASTAVAQPTQSELKARFEKRYPQIAKLLDQGKIGETWQGYVEAVAKAPELDENAKKLIDDENSDRKRLYELLSAKNEKKLTPAQIGERNARRKFQEAKIDWFLKSKEADRWIQRKEVTALRKEGKIGETGEGYVEIVKPEFGREAQIKAVVATENQIRKDTYRKQADENNSTPEAEAEAAGKRNLENAKSGEYIKRKGGAWERVK